jgi:hypothetical protein
MAVTFAEAKQALSEVAERIVQNRKRLDGAKSTISQAEADLAAMTGAYGGVVAAIDAAVVADPTDTAFVNLKAEKGKLVAEFGSEKGRATAMKNAVAAL